MIPYHLGNLANIPREIEIAVQEPCTQRSVLDALESLYPVLRGTIRDHSTKQRRPFVRFFACGEDYSHASPDEVLPDAVVKGLEPFLIVGAMAGG
jgi:sulfur-carrier protein